MPDYLIFVNKTHPLKETQCIHWKFHSFYNVDKDICMLEEETYQSFLKLQEAVLRNTGLEIGIDCGFRSLEAQEALFQTFQLQYGEEYAKQFVAKAGTSEHHTGLAIDLNLKVDGNFLKTNLELEQHEQEFKKIHTYLKEYGFILRYPKGKEKITGYPSEIWHIRYVGRMAAEEIMTRELTLEEYLIQKKKIHAF